MIEPGTVLQNRYLIEQRIGEGGMGVVYQAVDQKFNSRVAIKETFYKEKDLGEAFEREARLLNSLHHPILPHVSDYFTGNSGHFLVMEFIEGEDLSDILNRDGIFPIEAVLRWTDELLDALDYLHSQEPPIIHRDIKPSNLKLTIRGNLILLDFGLAKLNQADKSGLKSVFGYSRTYSPLEQIEGTGTDARSDIFALGATIFHLLTGQRPADSLMRAAAIVAGKPDPLKLANEINPQVSLAMAQVLHTALALNPNQRFASAKVMRQALKLAINQVPEHEDLPEQVFAAAATGGAGGNQESSVPDRSQRFQQFLKASILTSAEAKSFHAPSEIKNFQAPVETKDFPVPVETKNFPALAAFAAEVAESPISTKINEPAAIQVQIAQVELPADSPKILSPDVFAPEAADSSPPKEIDELYSAVQIDKPSPVNQVEVSPIRVSPIKVSTVEPSFEFERAPLHQVPASNAAKQARWSNNPSLTFAAIATILVGIGLMAWLFSRSNSSTSQELDQAPLIQSTAASNVDSPAPNIKTEKPALDKISPNPKTLPPASEKKTQTILVADSPEKDVETRKTSAASPEKIKKTEAPVISQNQPPKPPPASPAREIAKPSRDTRQRVHQSSPPVSSIERIMSGDLPKRYEQQPREEQRVFRGRRQRERMSEQESEELRRRRTEEVLRRNRQPN
jgi:serine/threonine protein kinase